MFLEIVKFELYRGMKRISTYSYFGLFFILAFLMSTIMGEGFSTITAGMIGGEKGVMANSPYSLYYMITILSFLSIFIIGELMGSAGCRDFETKFHLLYFSLPIGRNSYVIGRFFGNFLILLFILSGLGLGVVVGSSTSLVNPAKYIGSTQVMAYITPFLLSVLPNLFFVGALFFGLALRVRKTIIVYVAAISIVMGYVLSFNIVSSIGNSFLTSLLDPSGIRGFSNATTFWTAYEKNNSSIPFSGDLVWNRIFWIVIGLMIFIWAIKSFYFSLSESVKKKKSKERMTQEFFELGNGKAFFKAKQSFSYKTKFSQFFHLLKSETQGLFRNIYLWIIVFMGIVTIIIKGFKIVAGTAYGAPIYPVTYKILELSGNSFFYFFFMIILFFSGEMVWRERKKGFSPINDSLPVSLWAPFLSKLGALILMEIVLCFLIMLSSIGVQYLKGYTQFEILHYFQEIFIIRMSLYVLWTVFAFFIHIMVNKKTVAYLGIIIGWSLGIVLPMVGIADKLMILNSSTPVMYSDMNGYGHLLGPFYLFKLYWGGFALILISISYLFWINSNETSLKGRLKIAFQRSTLKPKIIILTGFLISFLTGSVLFYQTHVLRDFKSFFQLEERLANYEKRYKKYENLKHPSTIDIQTKIDLFPLDRKAKIEGRVIFKNKTSKPIPAIHFWISPNLKIEKLIFNHEGIMKTRDRDNGYNIFALKNPLLPNESINLNFKFVKDSIGINSYGIDTEIIFNGSYLTSMNFLPYLGYSKKLELKSSKSRIRHGLKPLKENNDHSSVNHSKEEPNFDIVSINTTVSTKKGQIAVAPGELIKQWKTEKRVYYQYKLKAKSLDYLSVVSADYQVKRDNWNGVDIEIFHHPSHKYNIDKMMEAIKTSLKYYTKNFGPYNQNLIKIVEFPRYSSNAKSLPTTIYYSEGAGFIAKPGKEDIDSPLWVTAHEVSHQWWGGQLFVDNSPGSNFLLEGFAEYSALMVAKTLYGEQKVKKMLEKQMHKYFIGRGEEGKTELPLVLVDNDSDYIVYAKGSIVLYTVGDYIGEDVLNKVLSDYLKDVSVYRPRYTKIQEFLTRLRKVVPKHLKYIVNDLFETITHYENKAKSAGCKKLPNGKYEVTLNVIGKKIRTNNKGIDNEIPINDWIDIGVLDKNGKVLYLEKKLVNLSKMTFHIQVDEKPYNAGIDPLGKLLDIDVFNNLVKIN